MLNNRFLKTIYRIGSNGQESVPTVRFTLNASGNRFQREHYNGYNRFLLELHCRVLVELGTVRNRVRPDSKDKIVEPGWDQREF